MSANDSYHLEEVAADCVLNPDEHAALTRAAALARCLESGLWWVAPSIITAPMLHAYWNAHGGEEIPDGLLTSGDRSVLQIEWNAMRSAAPTFDPQPPTQE